MSDGFSDAEAQALLFAFGQGVSCAKRDGYRSECSYRPSDPRYDAWVAGFEWEDGDTVWTLLKGLDALSRV